jgi:hypothetical protein
MSVNFDVTPRDNEPCGMILERDRIRIISPIFKVIGKLYETKLVECSEIG